MKEFYKKARKEGWAIGQFNVSNLESLRGVLQAAKELKSPVIIGTSEGESRFIGLRQAVALVNSFKKELALPIALNLDHGKDFDYIKKAVNEGYECVHFDGSKLIFSENIEIARRIVKYAHRKKVFVEGEVGFIQGSSKFLEKAPEIKKEDLTDPEEALYFVKKTGVDSLAINIGTFHGISRGENGNIFFERLKEIKDKIGNKAFLVLHGGSGISEENIKKAISLGITKININTDLRIAFTESLRKSLSENPEETTPYKYMAESISSVQKAVEEKIRIFGSENKI
jgi:fructose-bisphosphate aldolase class II